ncbi:hypothetical protein E8E13_009106 [Curvularia kusanoi]|uniref:F-box domain-containing protein n=1 Tax=Curvularia kusanoi TaxID=90978 RepID=A0A9P4WB81_CURKU|nr:hypothetical protein E8E13_009106 [Curvularia kusanoi]
MADQPNLDKLPPELQAMIFELLPTSAVKAMRLVSKHYSTEAAKALWTDTTISLDHVLESLPATFPNGLVDNVRRLSVKTESYDWDWKNDVAFELLNKLPRDRLLAFQCQDFAVSGKVLETLLEKHSYLSELSIFPDDNGLPDTSVVRGNSSRLQSAHIQLAYQEEIPRGISALFERISGLQEMRLEPRWYDDNGMNWSSPPPDHWPNLQRLVICRLNLQNTMAVTAAPPYVPQLKALELLNCSRFEGFLQLIAGQNKEGPGCRTLESFICQTDISEFNRATDVLARLLKLAKCLTRFILDIDGHEEHPILSRVGPPVNPWKELQFTMFSDPWRQLRSAHDIAYIAVGCKNLERLVIGIKYDFEVNRDPFDLTELMHTSGPLINIAKMPTLKRLS